jgi:hypothetical protein
MLQNNSMLAKYYRVVRLVGHARCANELLDEGHISTLLSMHSNREFRGALKSRENEIALSHFAHDCAFVCRGCKLILAQMEREQKCLSK